MKYKGSCHCGEILFDVEGDLKEVIECNCSHCSRKGFLLWFVPRPQLHLATAETKLSTYMFNRHVIKHHFCARCGCAPFGFGADRNGTATVAVNIRCLENLDVNAIKRVPFDGLSM